MALLLVVELYVSVVNSSFVNSSATGYGGVISADGNLVLVLLILVL
ncbi:hypothetical protein [Methanobrevibacter oralis]|nr:hypothetical protein [Methanobrevibacter oralis]